MDTAIVLHLPSKVFCALTNHTGEGFYGPKTEAALSNLILDWIATTKAAPPGWLDEEDADHAIASRQRQWVRHMQCLASHLVTLPRRHALATGRRVPALIGCFTMWSSLHKRTT